MSQQGTGTSVLLGDISGAGHLVITGDTNADGRTITQQSVTIQKTGALKIGADKIIIGGDTVNDGTLTLSASPEATITTIAAPKILNAIVTSVSLIILFAIINLHFPILFFQPYRQKKRI